MYVAIHEAGAPRNGDEVVIGHYPKKERGRNLTGNSLHGAKQFLKRIFFEDMIKLKCKINTRYFIFKTILKRFLARYFSEPWLFQVAGLEASGLQNF